MRIMIRKGFTKSSNEFMMFFSIYDNFISHLRNISEEVGNLSFF